MKKNKQKLTKENKPKDEEDNNYWLPIGMSIGLCLGVGVGAATNNMSLWLPIGLCLGVSLGVAFSGDKDNKDKKK